jgi:hypothetical protein
MGSSDGYSGPIMGAPAAVSGSTDSTQAWYSMVKMTEAA